MSLFRALILPCAALSLALGLAKPAHAQTQLPAPLREYDFVGNLSDNYGGPDLSSLGGATTSGSYLFLANQGLSLVDPAFDPANYTIQLQFSFASIGGYQRILDFKDRTSDTGLYAYSDYLNFYGAASSPSFTDFAAHQSLNLIVTRDSVSNLFSVYVNGALHLSFTDTNGLAIFSSSNHVVRLFTDDLVVANEAGAGSLDWLRLYNAPLDSTSASALYALGSPTTVPEPSTLALGILGVGLLFLVKRRRAR